MKVNEGKQKKVEKNFATSIILNDWQCILYLEKILTTYLLQTVELTEDCTKTLAWSRTASTSLHGGVYAEIFQLRISALPTAALSWI